MDLEALQESLARAAAKLTVEQFPPLVSDAERRIATERVYARVKAALEWYTFFTARSTRK